MSIKKTLLAAVAALLPTITSAQTTTVDFEGTGVGVYANLAPGYAGFTWTNVLLIGGGYGPGITSGSYMAYTHCCTSGAVEIARATPFWFMGAMLTNYAGASGDRIVGYLGATEVFDHAMTFGPAPTFNDFSSYGAVDRLVWKNGDGSTTYVGNTFVDDFQFSEVAPQAPVTATPEPASVALMATGLIGIAAAARRRRALLG